MAQVGPPRSAAKHCCVPGRGVDCALPCCITRCVGGPPCCIARPRREGAGGMLTALRQRPCCTVGPRGEEDAGGKAFEAPAALHALDGATFTFAVSWSWMCQILPLPPPAPPPWPLHWCF
eukprot:334994-Chlamydomonas_euryale.AAC.1